MQSSMQHSKSNSLQLSILHNLCVSIPVFGAYVCIFYAYRLWKKLPKIRQSDRNPKGIRVHCALDELILAIGDGPLC